MVPVTSSKNAEARGRGGGHSLCFRLSALFAVITTLVIGATGLSLDFWLSAHVSARARAQLEADLEHFRHLLAELPDRERLAAGSHWFSSAPGHSGELQASAIDPSGALIAGSPPFDWPRELVERAKDVPVHDVVQARDRAWRVMLARAPIGRTADTVIVGIARDKAQDDAIIRRFREALLIAGLLASLAAAAFGYAAAWRGLLPLRRMVQAATRMRAQNLHDRLDANEYPGELRELACSFNAMLERLDQSFTRLSDFSADLAHELRSPLSSLMLQAQVALGKPRSEAQLRQVLESGLEELDRLARMTNDMLFLAKADHAGHALKREAVALEEEANKVFEYFEPLAAERQVGLEVSGAARVLADRSMIRRMIANLVSNAVRHATLDSTVQIACANEGSTAAIAVTNAGIEVSAEMCERVFDRFFRVESSRSAPTEGAGLGLAIVKSIVELHGGRIGVESRSGRTTFRAVFPAYAPVPEQPVPTS